MSNEVLIAIVGLNGRENPGCQPSDCQPGKRKEYNVKKKIDWARKLASRKFWAAAVGFVTPIRTLARVPENTAMQVTAIIMAGGTLIAYIIGEGLTDVAGIDKIEKD